MFSNEPRIPQLLLIKEPTTREEIDFLPTNDMLLWGTPVYFLNKRLEEYETIHQNLILNMSQLLTHAYKENIISLIPVEPEPGYYFTHLRDPIAYRRLVDKYIDKENRHYAKTSVGRY